MKSLNIKIVVDRSELKLVKEKKIRDDPFARTTQLLKRVFALQDEPDPT